MEVDYVIVGGGSAGCVLANRLSASAAQVVLLEAGSRDWHPMIHIPAGIRSLLHNPLVNWNYASEPEEGTAGRAIHWPRGKVLGGSSSINGMLYVRGNAADFDTWAQKGCRGWSYEEVLPYFRRSERYAGGDDGVRGRDGELTVADYRTILPLTHRFVEAAQQAGFAFNPDLNSGTQDGVGYSQMTRAGRLRASTAQAFLRPARRRRNLRVLTGALVTGLTFDGLRCTGVRFLRGGTEQTLRARREVIVSGGAVNSPHLLQISGIGPQQHLRSIGVQPLHDLPGVGSNLNDHYVTRVAHRIRDLDSINQFVRGPKLLVEAGRWLLQGRGALTFGVTSAQVFCHSREGLAAPDLQLLFTPASYDANRFGVFEREPGASVAVCPARPDSRGTIMAASGDPRRAPVIAPNYLSARSDLAVMRAGIAHARRIFAAPALAQHSGGELQPGEAVRSDEELADFARRAGNTLYHPVGTCAMGEGPGAVVDPRLRVHGIGGLRVVDASVMPQLMTGNTNAPTIMIAEKASDMILEDARSQG
jgi:choline dehydrogenase